MYVGQLPSEGTYIIFNDAANNCNHYDIEPKNTESELKIALTGHTKVQNEVEKILKAWCYAFHTGGSNARYSSHCSIFYYWLGDKIWQDGTDVSTSASFQDIMKNIYDILGKIKPGQGCDNIYHNSNIDKTLFHNGRIIYDFSYDYNNIEGNLSKNRATYCNAYKDYLEKASKAYTELCIGSESEGNSFQKSVCGTFIREGSDKLDPQQLLQQYCQSILAERNDVPQVEAESRQEVCSGEESHTVSTTEQTPSPSKVNIPAIFSGLALTVGLPTIAVFFLYKYNLLPSWFHNKIGNSSTGRSRRGRRSTQRHHFEDNLTEYSTDVSTSSCLQNLPSRKSYYDKFEGANDSCPSDGIPNGIEDKLKNHVGGSDNAKKIVKAWYDKTIFDEHSISSSPACTFFYYWLGDKIPRTTVGSNSFPSSMNKVYENLGYTCSNQNCSILYSNIERDIFISMKSVYEYKQNYGTIDQHVKSSQAPEFPCTEAYVDYLEKVVSAYNSLSTECKGGNENYWCKDFQKMAKERAYDELLQLKCSLKHTPDCPSNSVAAAISGTLATTIGLPVIGYALYKYKLLPSWLHNKIGKNSRSIRNKRGKGSSAYHFDDDTLTDSSTEYGTDYSTTTDNSTIADSVTKYSAPPSGRRTNKRQQQQGQRNNIAYQRM
ncbi:KIR-like protein [Plasmodium coatneyi]|uniref:KIR-like protein n=1 Tax=Plasmodium coatneyi TaxID=208452 RepID=A0A1B1DY00_9APIC|nr:KIR-like protein [Plasmodium coatneyi]ANQ07634.1 KIR-like protein [Plasmodium coatneyi]